ncbi:FtsK/SpoIIIE domain-containing protein [Geodermatophilus sp. YIM 151500]|uniref:FtsK/SpoIIIE domain-containing protein n=1 Tax=Geodermatophilus sp. YIM 151500 TaxID=2984531 RepID=UPI0021E4C639|nr:FtsK/SpoIIIE domain-containing protein [Geodermatophilus sp. YIM 151500]MCV2488630.1 FtsK/SpoIIIE domain-containing protein [Geodermatophilus sp. YIM 151500]
MTTPPPAPLGVPSQRDDGQPPPAARGSRCWTLHGREGAVDVELLADDSDAVCDALRALRRDLGVPVEALWAGSSRLADDVPLTHEALRHGAVLGVDRPGPRRPGGDRIGPDVPIGPSRGSGSALELRVVGGPDAGIAVPLPRGRHVVGRGAGAAVQLADPDVSRRHAEVRVGGGSITVADLGSTNGSRLDGRVLAGGTAWPAGAVLRLGRSALTVAGPTGTPLTHEIAAGGRARVRAPTRLPVPPVETEVTFPRPPSPVPPRRLAWVGVALPAVGGVALSVLLRTPTFLFFALLGPLVALGTWWSDRWSGRRSGRRAAADHAADRAAAEQRLAEAVAADVRLAEAAHPDLATLATAARRRTTPLWVRRPGDADALVIRVGTGPGRTRVLRRDPDAPPAPARADHLPVVVDLRATGGLAVTGPRERALGVLRAVVVQVAVLHPPDGVTLLLLLEPGRVADWRWARWLPHLPRAAVRVRPTEVVDAADDDAVLQRLTAAVAAARAGGTTGSGPSGTTVGGSHLVVIVDRPIGAPLAACLLGARDAGVVVLTSAAGGAGLPFSPDAVLRLTGETGDEAVLVRRGAPDNGGVVVDRLAPDVAADVARHLAPLTSPPAAGTLPRRTRLLDVPSTGLRLAAGGGVTGSWSRARDRLVAPLGWSAGGPHALDLCRQGPHALVAGTTGSGKSELLRTLIAGWALAHPPDRCSFLLVDYKGGAAFGEAAHLPHTVGLLTDLDGASTARALSSLTAELVRREEVLAAAGVTDLAALPDDVDLARLVIVVDEFATLVEELPAFVPGLVGIAQRGRSLGVHLVLATQRPGGVVSPEIKANSTLRICLRTTDESDSRDVLAVPAAAHLPVDVPGRAYVRSGGAAPVLLQIAHVAAQPPREGTAGPQAVRWQWPAGAAAAPRPGGPEQPSDLAAIVAGIRRHTATSTVRLPHRPWRRPLPDEIFPGDLMPSGGGPESAAGGPSAAGVLSVGLVDLPRRQAQEPLRLDLREGGGWLAAGGPRSGRTTFLRTVLSEAARSLPPDDLHVHVIDMGGGSLAAEAAPLPHTGTVTAGDDALRTVRLVDRLAGEVARRRAGPRTVREPLVLLLVDGAEAAGTLLDDGDPARGAGALLRLVREGAAAGLTCVLTADRAVPGGRLAAAVTRRLVLPLPDRADYAVAGVPARAVPGHRPPGRALLGEDAVECQLARPRPGWPPATATAAAELRGRRPGTGAPGGRRPLKIVELEPDPVLTLPSPAPASTPAPTPDTAGAAPALELAVGPGGDEGSVLRVDLLRSGGLLVAGPPGSGRTTALDAFTVHLAACGHPVLRVGRPRHGGVPSGAVRPGGPPRPGDAVTWAAPDEVAAVSAWLQAREGRPGAVVVDDLGAPAAVPALGALPAAGEPAGVALLAAAGAADLAGHYAGPVSALRRQRSLLLLCPGPGDADLLGVRLPRTPVPVRPGSGWLAVGGQVLRVQVARRRQAGPP